MGTSSSQDLLSFPLSRRKPEATGSLAAGEGEAFHSKRVLNAPAYTLAGFWKVLIFSNDLCFSSRVSLEFAGGMEIEISPKAKRKTFCEEF